MAPFAIDGLFKFGTAILERIFPDPNRRAEAALELEKLRQSGELAELASETDIAKGQIEINVEEAKHQNIFVAGWRPFIGWVCGGSLAFHFMVRPIAAVFGATVPSLDIGDLIAILIPLLGLGGMRTYEKLRGVSKG